MTSPELSLDRETVLGRYTAHVNTSMASLSRLVGAPVEVTSAGTKVTDETGERYLDCGGYGVFLLGHRHPAVVDAVRRQLEDNPLATRLFLNPQLADASAALASVTPPGLDYVFLTNSGAEATEVGLKLARLAGHTRVIAMHGGFHGKTLGALSVTGRPGYREPFEPLLPDVSFVRYGDLAELDAALGTDGARTCVILEPVQAEGGVIVPPAGYLSRVRELCTARRAMLIVDEIQTGLGRLGFWWGGDAEGVAPDVLLSGKILGGGVVPVGAVAATAAAFAPLNRDPLLHSSTFAGNPLAAAAVSATIATIRTERIVERSRDLGPAILAMAADAVLAYCPQLVREVRGRGLLIGIEFLASEHAANFLIALLERHVIASYSLNSHAVLRLTPPAILDAADLDWLGTALAEAARELGRARTVFPPPRPPLPLALPTATHQR